MNIIKTYTSPETNTFDVIVNETVVAYYYEYFVNPETNEKLEKPVYEIYYDLNDGGLYDLNDGYFDSSLITEDFADIEEILDDLS